MTKYLSIILVIFLASCQQNVRPDRDNRAETTAEEGIYGEKIMPEGAVTELDYDMLFEEAEMAEFKVAGHIAASCKYSGCWMDIELSDGEVIHVTFLDESFTIPLDASGKDVIAGGIVSRKMIPVETLQNYAREDGKSDEEIAAITEPAFAYKFIAKGVIIE